MTKHTILFLAANPSATDRLALDREARSIHLELMSSGYRDRFLFETRWAVEPLDVLRELRKLKPAVVHFSGHGGPSGLRFQTADGEGQDVAAAALAEAFGAAGASVKLVVLSRCYGETQAVALLAHIDHVVGINGAVHDEVARIFAIGFYGGLGEHESIASAYQQGRAAINLQGLPDADRPQLRVRASVDATRLILAAVNPPQPEELPPCPYPGLRPYSADTATYFHGRDAEVEGLLGRLRAGAHEIYVIGPSGSGKSSLVAAGVLPRLARGVSGVGPFVVRSMRPGEQPAARLREVFAAPALLGGAETDPSAAVAKLLVHRAPSAAVLLVIDQLEELFTLASAGERAKFLDALRALRTEPRCVLVLVLRADFYGALMDSSLWTDLHGQLLRVDVAPLRGQALREAIERPSRDLAVSFEPELVKQLLDDAASEPGALPLLQETLNQLWDHQLQRRLTLANYQALSDGTRSGLAVALSHLADVTLHQLTSPRQAIARRILLRLVNFGEGRSDTRRQQPLSALRVAGDNSVDFDEVVQRLVDRRLLTIDDNRVDLAHEIMIGAWPKLADWIQTHRAAEQRRRQLEAAAEQWVMRGRGVSGLLDPIELAEAEAWQRTESARELGESRHLVAFIAASKEILEKQHKRRRRLTWSSFGALIVVIGVISTLAVMERRKTNEVEASRRRLLARSYFESGRQLVFEGNFLKAIPYLVAARKEGEDGPAIRILFGTASRYAPLTRPLEYRGDVKNVTFSADGTRVVATTRAGTALAWEAVTGESLPLPLVQQDMNIALSSDATRIAAVHDHKIVRILDTTTGKSLSLPLEHQGPVTDAAFSPDGNRIAIICGTAVYIWDIAPRKLLSAPLTHPINVTSIVFSHDGTSVVTANGKSAQIWDVATGKSRFPPLEHRGSVNSASFSSDGTRVVTASGNLEDEMFGGILGFGSTHSGESIARVWDAVTGKPLSPPLEHVSGVKSAAFSPDGTRIVTASKDDTAQIWDAVTGKPLSSPLKHQDFVESAAFSPDGTRIVTASRDRTARIWDAMTGKPLSPPLEHQGSVQNAAFSPDGKLIVTVSSDQMMWIWDATPVPAPLEHQSSVESAVFSPDGTRIVTTSSDHTVQVWDVSAGKRVSPPLEHQDSVESATFSSDGSRILTVTGYTPLRALTLGAKSVDASAGRQTDETIVMHRIARVWDASTGKLLYRPLEYRDANSVTFNSDGSRVVTASGDTFPWLLGANGTGRRLAPLVQNVARVWDTTTGKPLSPPLMHRAPVKSAALNSDGTRVVTTTIDQTVQVWDTLSGRPLFHPIESDCDRAIFGPGDSRIVIVRDMLDPLVLVPRGIGDLRIWKIENGQPLSPDISYYGAFVENTAFNADWSRVVMPIGDRAVMTKDTASGNDLCPNLEHQGHVASAAFSSDGSRVVTTGDDKTARIWDVATCQQISAPLEHLNDVNSAVFSPDGRRVVTASKDKTARVWEILFDGGTITQWSSIAERVPYTLSNGVLSGRDPRPAARPLR